jgi:hypothetical protein
MQAPFKEHKAIRNNKHNFKQLQCSNEQIATSAKSRAARAKSKDS